MKLRRRRERPDPLLPVLAELGELRAAVAALAERVETADASLRWMVGEVSTTAQRALALVETVHHMVLPDSPDGLPASIRQRTAGLAAELERLRELVAATGTERSTAGAALARQLADTDAALRWMLGQVSDRVQETLDFARATHHEIAHPAGEMRSGTTPWERQVTDILRYLADEDAANRRLVWQMRAAPDYEAAFDDPDPLVSVVIATFDRPHMLRDRSVPSVLAQTHRNLELIVVGEAAPDETAEVLAAFGDPRIRYTNLNRRGPYPDQELLRWYVAGTMPANEGARQASGHWLAFLDDDDAMRPYHLEHLLDEARVHRAEVCYGPVEQHTPTSSERHGTFPPKRANFGWGMAIVHAGLRGMTFDTSAALFGEPGDWHLARRMLAAGVRFHMVDEIVADYYPSRQWTTRDD